MKLNAAVTRLVGASNNVQNAISFLEVQDGMLETAGKIVNRMAEMKGMATADPMKSAQDIASYDNEFRDLQLQLHQIAQQTFNGASIFASTTERNGGSAAVFGGASQNANLDHTISIFTSDNGSDGTKIDIHRSLLLSALTINSGTMVSAAYTTTSNSGAAVATAADISFASEDTSTALTFSQVSMKVFEQALSNIAFLRAQTGGGMSRLNFAADSIASYTANMRAAVGRIEDVDIALESSNLAKYSIMTQASAAMVAQANSSNDAALMLLR
jgi:flagellin